MILISHRGNTNSSNPILENTHDYIDEALNKNYICEVDVWRIDRKLYLSHDEPMSHTLITEESFLTQRSESLIIHCKNIEALEYFHCKEKYHYFWHQNDDYTITSLGWIWAYPGKLTYNPFTFAVAVMPELHNTDISNFFAICSDYVDNYK